ncbi:hypothetical protein [Ornithinibacillus halotolerans]|uniref:DUF3139 domain-containing protein n=1 Tax=Ornithinibacillus halotolerans TaxID=1274357 RepID=A0A916S1Y3_9BACI|nr:hypothetical protein [Ornithinibacillus halotolerans]GGA80615.1 hypothetical protein GCM10008025_25020 [Ornithinibacillus halotolerans]
MHRKKKTAKDWITFAIITFIIIGGAVYYVLFFTPKNSLELYQELHFADNFEDVQKHMLEGYEDNFSEEDFNYIQNNVAKSVSQYTVFEYNQKSYIIMTSPGTERLKILTVEELPEEVRQFFLELSR